MITVRTFSTFHYICFHTDFVYMCVCVREREGEKARERDESTYKIFVVVTAKLFTKINIFFKKNIGLFCCHKYNGTNVNA